MEKTNLNTLPLEIQHNVLKFLSFLDKAHLSFVSKSCAQAVFSEPPFLKEKEKMKIKKMLSTLNLYFNSEKYDTLYPGDIKYMDDNAILIRIDQPFEGCVFERNSFLLLLKRQEIEQLITKEINKISTITRYHINRQDELIDTLEKADSNLNNDSRRIKI